MRTLFLLLFAGTLGAQTLPNAVAAPSAEVQFLDANGVPLAGGKIYTYIAGTTMPQDTYTNSGAGTANSNPIVLDAAGRAQIWIGPNAYKFVVEDVNSVVQWTEDNLIDTTLYFANFVKNAGTCTVITFVASGTGAVSRTCTSKLSDIVSVLDYGAVGDGSTLNDTALARVVSAACAASHVPRIYFPAGQYNISVPLALGCPLTLMGDGATSSIIFQSVQSNLNEGISTAYGLTMQDMAVNTTALTVNDQMSAIYALGAATNAEFSFTRVNSTGFNFGIEVAGVDFNSNMVGSVLVDNCVITIATAAGNVANAVGGGYAASFTVRNSRLLGTTNNDHMIYFIAARQVAITNNYILAGSDVAIKLLSGGLGSGSCPSIGTDYQGWNITGNTILDAGYGIQTGAYCNVVLPQIVIRDNLINTQTGTSGGQYAAVNIQSACEAVIASLVMAGNVYQDLQLGGVALIAEQQVSPCATASSTYGSILNYASNGEEFDSFSNASSGTWYAINTVGPTSPFGLLRASVAQVHADGGGTGLAALNLVNFQFATVTDALEINVVTASTPVNSVQSGAQAQVLNRWKMAAGQTGNVVEQRNSSGTLIGSIAPTGAINFPYSSGLYNASGTFQAASHIVLGSSTLSAGTVNISLSGAAAFTSGGSYSCAANDKTATNPVSFNPVSGSLFGLSGTSTDTVSWTCVGN